MSCSKPFAIRPSWTGTSCCGALVKVCGAQRDLARHECAVPPVVRIVQHEAPTSLTSSQEVQAIIDRIRTKPLPKPNGRDDTGLN
jgi:hypothetical protein